MSDIRANTISDTSGNGPINLTGQSAAKAWVYGTISGGSPTLVNSFNVTSISDGGLGTFKFNLTSSMNNANFAISVTNQYTSSQGTGAFFDQEASSNRTASSFSSSHYQNGTSADPLLVNGILHGDLA